MIEDLQRLIEIQQIDDDINAEKSEQEALKEDLDGKAGEVEDAKAVLKDHEEQFFELKKEKQRRNIKSLR